MHLIIQIPCLNEEGTLADVVNSIPTSIAGVEKIEIVIIDDGSTDNTSLTAKKLGVHHVIRNKTNKGLAASFQIGLQYAISQGADILVNTDGDNQYPSDFIPFLIEPILTDTADIVVGNRQTNKIKHFSPVKKLLQRIGTSLTNVLSGGAIVEDAVSGFRAYSKSAMKELNITSRFSYVLDSTVQANQKGLSTVFLPIRTNTPTRPSRLFKNIWQHIWLSGTELLRVFSYYRPFRVFATLGLILFLCGSIPIIRFFYDFFYDSGGQGKIQSLIIGSVLLSASFNLFALGVIGELLSKNRMLIERILNHTK